MKTQVLQMLAPDLVPARLRRAKLLDTLRDPQLEPGPAGCCSSTTPLLSCHLLERMLVWVGMLDKVFTHLSVTTTGLTLAEEEIR